MKILYTTDQRYEDFETITSLNKQKNWKVTKSPTDKHTMMCCTKYFYDVIILDLDIPDFDWKKLIKNIRNKQIFTPILILSNSTQNRLSGLKEGADMCLQKPFNIDEIFLCIRTLKRRNTNYQTSTISFGNVKIDRPAEKIYSPFGSLSVNSTEIELFRLLTRANNYIKLSLLAEKLIEPEEKVLFSINCLIQKLQLLNANVHIIAKNNKCLMTIISEKKDVS